MKDYAQMTTKEQLEYITDLSVFTKEKLPRLEKLGDAWEAADRKDFETGLRLLGAFAFARDYASQSLFYGDYNRRVARINYYLDRIKKEISKGNALKGANGETLAYVPAQKISRRRGRPTKEEKAQMEADKANEGNMALESEKAYAIANLLDLNENVVVEAPVREKTDAEKVAEVKAKVVQKDLFSQIGEAMDEQNFTPGTEKSSATSAHTPRLTLQQVKPYLSADLSKMVDTVQSLRASFGAKSERAKLLAEQGAKAEEVAVYAQEAHDLNEQIGNIYDAVDKELAMVYGRLRDDDLYRAEFLKEHADMDVENVKKMLKPYFDKMPETFSLELESVIRESNPQVIADKEKAAADKVAADKIIKYLTRKDKPSTAKRLDTMKKRLEELRGLIGEEAANVYLPYVNKCEEDLKMM